VRQKMSNPSAGEPPAYWNGLVNLAIALPIMLGVPAAIYYFAGFPIWSFAVVGPVWIFMTARITDRYIPDLTAPMIQRTYHRHEDSKAWYPIPFVRGRRYRVVSTIIGDFEKLEEGTEVIYTHSGFSRYDGYIGFFFEDVDGEFHRWDIREDENPISEAQAHFEETK
ncbi:MAG: hypothetical protein AB8D78_13015, partial [Akkermansiaceae bacterium]